MTIPIWVFLDLDDTLFQTQRKRNDGIVQATQGTTLSYMTPAQAQYLQWLQHTPALVNIVPTTARDLTQYYNTFLSQHPGIQWAILYHAGMILHQGQPDLNWQAQQQVHYQQLSQPVPTLWQVIAAQLDSRQFKLFNVDDYYVSIKARHETPVSQREEVFAQLKTLVCTADYDWQQTDRALHIFPRFLNKKQAVEYLIAQHQPTLTIGVGDSTTDLDFMHCCDYQVCPQHSEIARLMKLIRTE